MGRLDGKIALITGTASGQGRAAARLFAREGAKVAGCDLNAAKAEETVRLVQDEGGEMWSKAPVDLADADQAKAWVDEAAEHFGGIDILYNNAGANTVGPFAVNPVDDYRYTLRNEVDVIYFPTQAAWRHLVARGGGSIINTSSILADRVTVIPLSIHGVAKGAVASFTPHLAAEGGPHGIRVNTLSPGLIHTAETDMFLRDPNSSIHRHVRTSPLGRVGLPEDVAPVALFLASDDARYVTGANIVVDGGQTIGIALSYGEDVVSPAASVNEDLRGVIRITDTVEVTTADGVADAYVFTPEGATEGSWPGVLMYTDIMGVRPASLIMAQRVADAGFTVLMPNLFYRRGAPADPPRSVHNPEQLGQLLEFAAELTHEVIARDAPAFVEALKAFPTTTGGPVGCIGYCMSGRMAVWTAEAAPHDVALVASIHGTELATDGADNPAQIAASLPAQYYFALADTDPFMRPEQAAMLKEALEAAAASFEMELYPGTFHGFTVLDGSYDEVAAERHYERLAEHLSKALAAV